MTRVGTVPKSNGKNCRTRDKIETANTKMHDHSLSWLDASARTKCGWGNQVLWALSNLFSY